MNLGGGLFLDQSMHAGLARASRPLLGFGAAYFDANNDGWLDLATANGATSSTIAPPRPSRCPPSSCSASAAANWSTPAVDRGRPWQVPRLGRGLALADLDNDGRLDLLVASEDTPLAYFHIRSRAGHSLTLALEGKASNRDAVGAKVRIKTGDREITRWRLGGGSYLSAADPRIHVGTGAALARWTRSRVTWPSGRVDAFSDLAADCLLPAPRGRRRAVAVGVDASEALGMEGRTT